ncbi:MAG: hypothetical protein KME10_23975 [Plectolyngbya sp. WJT66-NPBG17]|nr:hypothetical protein [Plectolyngbya sp. WJT66-NPBG17]
MGLYSTDIFTAQFYKTLPGFYGDEVRSCFEPQFSFIRAHHFAKMSQRSCFELQHFNLK